MWKEKIKKHKKKIIIISLVLLVYTLVMFNFIPIKRGDISFNANSVDDCYSLASSRFVEERGCWYKYHYKNFVWNLNKVWSSTGCQPCHIQNSIFQNCVQSLNQGHNIKTKMGLSKKTFHTWSVVDGQEIDVYYKLKK